MSPCASASTHKRGTSARRRRTRRRNQHARHALEHARVLSDRASREMPGSAFEHPVPAGINCACDVGGAVLTAMPQHSHDVWYAPTAKALHLISLILTASPN
eukprot:IDg14460t1